MRVEELAVPKRLFEPAAPSDNPTSTPPEERLTSEGKGTRAPCIASEDSAASARRMTFCARSWWPGGAAPSRTARRNVLELDGNWLVRRELGREDVTRPVGEVVLAESLWILVDDAVVEDPDRLGRAVVVHDHLLASDEHRPAQLARREPAQLDVGERSPTGNARLTNTTSGIPGTIESRPTALIDSGISSSQ